MKKTFGFTLLEILVVIGIIAVIATIAFVSLSNTTISSRDSIRMTELNNLARFLESSGKGIADNLPAGVPTNGDLYILIDEVESRAGFKVFGTRPKDPNASGGESGFKYIISGGNVVIYTNLENVDEPITASYTEPTPGGGRHVFKGTGSYASGYNGTNIYYQVSN